MTVPQPMPFNGNSSMQQLDIEIQAMERAALLHQAWQDATMVSGNWDFLAHVRHCERDLISHYESYSSLLIQVSSLLSH